MYSTNTVPADPLFCAFWVKEPTQIIFGPTHSHYPSEVHGLWIVRPVLVDAVHSSSTSNAGYGMSQQSNLSCLEILHSIYLKICQKSLLSHWPLFQYAITSYCASKWRFYYQQHLPSLFFDVDSTFILQASEPITASFTHRMASWLQSPSGTGRSARRHLIAWRRHTYKPLHVLQNSWSLSDHWSLHHLEQTQVTNLWWDDNEVFQKKRGDLLKISEF